MSLSADEADVLTALCSVIAPTGGDEDSVHLLADAVARRLSALPIHIQRDLRLALRVFDHPVTRLLFSASTKRFAQLSRSHRERRFRTWGGSRLAVRRSIYQALRRLILSTYYSIPEHAAAIGYVGPLRDRSPVVPWEGALEECESGDTPGGTSDSDPVIARHATLSVLTARAAEPAGDVSGVTSATVLRNGDVVRADVCVIGSGAGGAVAAARLAEAGLAVVVVEEGGAYGVADFNDVEREMMPRLYADAGVRATDDGAISLLQGRCIGGGTTVNWMLMLRPRDWVMDEWEKRYGSSLLGAAELVPALQQIEREVRAGFLPDSAHSPSNRVILDGAAALGWSAEHAMINARGCVRAGTCGIGCSHGAKQSAGAVFLPRAVSAGAHVYSDASARRITSTRDAKTVHCSAVGRDSGRAVGEFSVQCKAVVVAAGAVGTPVLLQNSGMGGGAVGRYLRLHPTTAVTGLYDRVMYGAAGVPQSALLTQFMDVDEGHGFWVECPPLLPSLASVAIGGFGAHHRDTLRQFPNLAALIVLTRDGAQRDRSHGSVLVHRSGRVHIRYSPAARDRRTISAGIAAAARLHLAAGAREVATLHDPAIRISAESDIARIGRASLDANRIALFSAHVNGTCRTGTDATTSGCDPDGQRHDHPGVFIADGSIFPTAPGVNPQATIMAVGSLVADRVRASVS
jgi:choline dehydrogenase-like flavoprotein